MKKIIILPILLFASIIAYSQLGVKAGVNVCNFTGGDFGDIETNSKVGFHAGGLFRIKFDNLAVQPELLFSTQGAKLEEGGVEQDFNLNYVNIPIMLQWHFNGGFYIEAGPQFGFKVSEDTPEEASEDFAKSTDVSAGVGLGFTAKGGLGIGARYLIGISKVGDVTENLDIDPDFKQGVFQIGLFFLLFTKKE